MKQSEPIEKRDLPQELEALLDKLTTHPLFLRGVSSLLNFNSYRKIFLKRSMQQLWKGLELPNKRDQEKTLYLVSELQFKIQKLEKQLALSQAPVAPPKKETAESTSSTKTPGKTILTALQ